MKHAQGRPVSGLARWLCAFALGMAWGAAAAADKDLPIERMIGGDLVEDVDRALSENGVSSVAVIGFFATDSNQILASGISGVLPNELNRILASGLTNLLANGRNKYRVMSPTMISRRKKAAGLNADNIDAASTVGKILGGQGAGADDRYDAMLYGMIRKKGGADGRMVEINLWLARMSGGSVVRVALNYDYPLDSGPGDKRSLVFLGENFPPLFAPRPGKPRANNPSGLFGANSEIKVYVRVDGERLPFFHASDPAGENQAVVKIPAGAEYDIEIFDRSGPRRADARLFAAVMVDGIGTIGEWETDDGGPEEDAFMLADNPLDARKWVLAGNGEDSRDDAGNSGMSYIVKGWQSSLSGGRKFVFQKESSSLAAALSGQLSPNLGVVTAVLYAGDSDGKGGGYGTGMGQEFSNQVSVIEAMYDPDPKYVVNIRCIAEGGEEDVAEDEGLMQVTY